MIKAVLFDMDGILFDTEIVMKEGWQKAARELNFTLTEEHLSQMRGSALPRSRKLFEEWFHGQVTAEPPGHHLLLRQAGGYTVGYRKEILYDDR